MTLTAIALAAVLHTCAPLANPGTMAAIASVESSFNPYAIHDNTTNREYYPRSRGEAVQLLDELPGHQLDVGVVQVDFQYGVSASRTVNYFVCVPNAKGGFDRICGAGKQREFHTFTLTAYDALDPCHDVFAGSAILQEAWQQATADFTDPDRQLLGAIALYNTGTSYDAPDYVQKVYHAASNRDVLATAYYATSFDRK